MLKRHLRLRSALFDEYSTFSRLPSADIYPVVRVDSSGSTELLTNYLATDMGWSLGVGKSIAWPKCAKQVQGTDGILAYLGSQSNAIGCAWHASHANRRRPIIRCTPCFISRSGWDSERHHEHHSASPLLRKVLM